MILGLESPNESLFSVNNRLSNHAGALRRPSPLAKIDYRAKSAEGKVRHPFLMGAREDRARRTAQFDWQSRPSSARDLFRTEVRPRCKASMIQIRGRAVPREMKGYAPKGVSRNIRRIATARASRTYTLSFKPCITCNLRFLDLAFT